MLFDNLTDSIPNIQYWMGQSGVAGSRLSASTGAAVAIAAAETLVANIAITPGVTLKVGSIFRATLQGTYTAAAGSAPIFTIRSGILGTISDTSVASATMATSATTGTAILFSAVVTMNIVSLGATGAVVGNVTETNSGTTGISTTAFNAPVALGGTLTMPTTTAAYIDLSMTAGTSNSASITSALLEILN
jgi:hypothetical protein